MKRYVLVINVIYIVLIPIWVLLLGALYNFNIGFSWGPQPELFVSESFTILNMVFLFLSAVTLLGIGILLLSRYIKRRKDALLLLGMANIIISFGLFFDGVRKYMTITVWPYRNMVEIMALFVIAWGMIFYYLFLQEIFNGNHDFKAHRRSHIIYITLTIATNLFFIGFPELVDPFITNIFAYIPMLILIIALGSWQISAAMRLVKKTNDKRARIGIIMIGYSAIFYLAIIAVVGLKKIIFELDVLLSILLFAWSVVNYIGFIYPSKKKEEDIQIQE